MTERQPARSERKQRRGTGADHAGEIRGFLGRDQAITAAAALRLLKDHHPDLPRGRFPSRATVQDVLDEERALRAGRPWRIDGNEPESGGPLAPGDARLVLETLGVVMWVTEGRRASLTVAEAEWIARLRAIRPTLDPWTAFRLAWILAGQPDDETRRGVEGFLGFFPRTPGAWIAYALTVEAGSLPPPPGEAFETASLERLGRRAGQTFAEQDAAGMALGVDLASRLDGDGERGAAVPSALDTADEASAHEVIARFNERSLREDGTLRQPFEGRNLLLLRANFEAHRVLRESEARAGSGIRSLA